MAKYDVLSYPKAYRDIEEIYSYLAKVFVVTVQYGSRNI